MLSLTLKPIEDRFKSSSDIVKIAVSLASPDLMLCWSFGEVSNPTGLDFETGKPEAGGVFCPKVFGPVRDFECLCITPTFGLNACLVCGVEFVSSWERRKRFGHIELAAPVVHTWFYKSSPNVVASLLGMPAATVLKLINCELHLVTASDDANVGVGDYVNTSTYYKLSSKKGYKFVSGGKLVLKLLSDINVDSLKLKLELELSEAKSASVMSSLKRRLQLVDVFVGSRIDPKWMVLKIVPVLPPGLRPAVVLESAKYASSDLNELYKRVVTKNLNVETLANDPEALVAGLRELQRSVDALFDNSKTTPQALSYSNCALKSLSDLLKGKSGRFRQNLLGKRVDYSGRSVIAPGPELNLNECGIPVVMALELFKPFLRAKAVLAKNLNSLWQAKALLESDSKTAQALLSEVVRWHPVLLNRAPTLHKLSIQAFKVRLVNSKVIRLHPLVCSGFNADFDGDQMAVHVPLSKEARAEAVAIMLSTHNVLHPANGIPSILPTQDMILGLYYVSLVGVSSSSKCFSSYAEVSLALLTDQVKLDTRIRFWTKTNGTRLLRESTPGRLLFNELIPPKCGLFYDLSCPQLTKSYVCQLVETVCDVCGPRRMAKFCVSIMKLGFKYATESGVSIGRLDFPSSSYKHEAVSNTIKTINSLSERYRFNQRWRLWAKTVEFVSSSVDVELEQRECFQTSIQIMANSGARGTRSQIKQIVGLKGYVHGFDGKLCCAPILSSYRDGLSAIEFFYSSCGSRKGLIDAAIKTASSGYLTRKLVEAARDCVVTQFDCGAVNGIRFPIKKSASYVRNKLLGRTLTFPIMAANCVVVRANALISTRNLAKLLKYGGSSVWVRSPVTCEAHSGFCALCYGADLSKSKLVSLGEAVGVLAAQSIGEPGTQLTLRTFHDTGIEDKSVRSTRFHLLSPCAGVLRTLDLACVLDSTGDVVVMGNSGILTICQGDVVAFRYKLERGTRLLACDGEFVDSGALLCLNYSTNASCAALVSGVVSFDGFVENVSSRSSSDSKTGLVCYSAKPNKLLKARVCVSTCASVFKHELSASEQLAVLPGRNVSIGDQFVYTVKASPEHRSPKPHASLSKLANLFENNPDKSALALISPVRGKIRLGEAGNGVSAFAIEPLVRSQAPIMYTTSSGSLALTDNQLVNRGAVLIPGEVELVEFVSRHGMNDLVCYFTDKVQEIYENQGVNLNSKHVEVVIAQMTKFVEITSAGDSKFKLNQHTFWHRVTNANIKLKSAGLRLVKAQRMLLGISNICSKQKSLLSAIAYQDVVKLLAKAAISHASYKMSSIKERIMLGALTPVGTGFYKHML
ncbi:MAG: DNA-directed RNA polymerase subunit beta' [Candidatus Hodgkinia cicadicola]|nr:MAG: DNA-directed RNA polymerase subunit beta' [Candidatus Hodgkinia cicadicola]